MVVTLVFVMAVPFLLPARFSLGPRWLFPAIEGILAVAIVIADPGLIDQDSTFVRVTSITLVGVIVAGATGATVRLIGDLIQGGPETNSATSLLWAGLMIWLYAIVAFAFLYWELDGGGPEHRAVAPQEFPDLAFPEHLNPGVAPPTWRPHFFDYLYVGFTNATAFSPTDMMPLARWAKLAMAVQATGSLGVLGLVIARAINILK